MKKSLSAILAVAILVIAVSASAQTMRVWGEVGGVPSTAMDVPGGGASFDIVVGLDPAGSASSAAEFIVTEILQDFGVFKVGTAKINNTNLDLGSNAVGEYLLSFGACIPAQPVVELVRLSYVDFSGLVTSDYVIDLRGYQPGDTQPSSFNGETGFVNCNSDKIAAPMGGADGGVTDAGVVFPDGGMVLNPTLDVVPNEAGTMGQLKARF